MKTRSLGVLAAVSFVLTAIWLGLLIASMARSGPVGSFERALAAAARLDTLYYLTYANAALITLTVSALFAGLFAYCEPAGPGWSLVGFIFVPVYCLLNLVAYLSQITVVPQLLALQQTPETQATATVLLRMALQASAGSAVSVFNSLAYAVLGIPSLVYGAMLARGRGLLRAGGVLLALSGVACIVGMAGVVMQDSVLSFGSVVGGVIFLLALVPLAPAFLYTGARARPRPNEARMEAEVEVPAERTEGTAGEGAGG